MLDSAVYLALEEGKSLCVARRATSSLGWWMLVSRGRDQSAISMSSKPTTPHVPGNVDPLVGESLEDAESHDVG